MVFGGVRRQMKHLFCETLKCYYTLTILKGAPELNTADGTVLPG